MRIALALLVCAACSKQAPEKVPTCAEVTDRMLKIVQAEHPGHGDMGAMGNREQAMKQCEVRKMPAAERRCIVRAKTMEDLARCRRTASQNQGGSAAGPAGK